MKILSITAQKPHSTGSGTYLTELVRAFDRMGHEQAVVCGIYPEDEVSFPKSVKCFPVFFVSRNEQHGIHFPIVGMSDIMPYESTRYCDLTPEMCDEFEYEFVNVIEKAVDELDPDLIICHHLFLLTAIVREHFPDRTVVGICHGTDLRQMVNCEFLHDLVYPYIGLLDMAFALHEDQAVKIKSLFDIEDARVKVLGSGYNGELFNSFGRKPYEDDDPVRICYAGKISRPKGVPEMLAALAELADDPLVPEFRLAMAGGCQDEVLMKALDSLPPYVSWLGQIAQSDLAELFRNSDIFVLPSYFEGLPLVLIEAMASGCIPVSTDLPGVREWIDANVAGSNVRYVSMPDMKSIDEPTAEGRIAFTTELSEALRTSIKDVRSHDSGCLPDTHSITWDGAAERLLGFL